jgi:hypothetical protein
MVVDRHDSDASLLFQRVITVAAERALYGVCANFSSARMLADYFVWCHIGAVANLPVGGREHLLQGGIMGVVHRRIEQRPRLSGAQEVGNRGERQVAVVLILGNCIVEIAGGRRGVDAAQPQHKVLQRRTRKATLFFPAADGGILAVRELFDQFAQFAVHGVNGKGNNVGIARRNRCIEHAAEIVDFLYLRPDAIAFVRSLTVADRS